MTPSIPETYANKDWPRKVKQAVEAQSRKLAVVPSRAKLRFVS